MAGLAQPQPVVPPPPQAPPAQTPDPSGALNQLIAQKAGSEPLPAIIQAAQSIPGVSTLTPQQLNDAKQVYSDTVAARNPDQQPQGQQVAMNAPAPPDAGGALPPTNAMTPPPAPNTSPGGGAAAGVPTGGAQTSQNIDPNAPPQSAVRPELVVPPAPPHETLPPFKGATYHPPSKGLEYLALGIGLLFPGAPIGRAAAGFAAGLNQGAEQKYKREESEAEKDYQAKKDQADQDAANARADWQRQVAQAQADYQHGGDVTAAKNVDATNIFGYKQDLLRRGIDPATNKPMVFPPIESLLPKTVDPHTKKPVADNSLGGYSSAYLQLAGIARQRGATDLATQYDTDAKDYQTRAIAKANLDERVWATTVTAKTRLQAASMTQRGANARQAQREGFELDLQDRRDHRQVLMSDITQHRQLASQYMGQYRNEYTKDFFVSPGKDDKGNPAQPPLKGQERTIAGLQLMIDKSASPYETAQWLAQWFPPQVTGLLTTYGNARQEAIQGSGYKLGDFKEPTPFPKDVAQRIGALGPVAQQHLYNEILSGKTMKDLITEAESTSDPEKRARLVEALTGTGPKPDANAEARAAGTGGQMGAAGNSVDKNFGYKPGSVWDPKANKFVPGN